MNLKFGIGLDGSAQTQLERRSTSLLPKSISATTETLQCGSTKFAKHIYPDTEPAAYIL
ncbi:hypothetical protein D3C77_367510 [compost metagenome]